MNTLTHLFDWILAASARAALLTVVVFIIQVLLRNRVSARWRYALWLPVLIVLLMPVFPESSWSVSSITHLATTPPPVFSGVKLSATSPIPLPFTADSESQTSIPWQQIMGLVWLSGAVSMMILGLFAFGQTLRRIQCSRLPVGDALQRELGVLAREIGLRRVPRVWTASAIRSPAVTGLVRPTLLLPANFEKVLAPHEARLVLKHELMHIKRGDLPVHALLCLLLALHWFNPLLWLAFFKARLDRETACDAQVLDGENQDQRAAYGHTLLRVETAFCQYGLGLGFVGIFQRGSALRTRIRSIACPSYQHPLMKTTLGFSIVLLTFLGITKAAGPDPKAPQILIQTKFIEISSGGPYPVATLPAPLDGSKKAPGVMGILTDPQFQVMIRGLSQLKGVDLLSAPRVTTKDGQRAEIEVTREFAYKDEAVKPITKHCGVTLEVLPKVTKDDQIHLNLSPEIVEFEGFVTHKSGWKEPIFNDRKLAAKITMASGQTAVLEMDSRKDQQTVQDTDVFGHITKTETVVYTRRLLVFVTAELVAPVTGKPRASKPRGQ